MDLQQLAVQSRTQGRGPPQRAQWDDLEAAARVVGWAVEDRDAKQPPMKELLMRIPTAADLLVRAGTCSEAKQALTVWYSHIGWWSALRAVQSPVQFGT